MEGALIIVCMPTFTETRTGSEFFLAGVVVQRLLLYGLAEWRLSEGKGRGSSGEERRGEVVRGRFLRKRARRR